MVGDTAVLEEPLTAPKPLPVTSSTSAERIIVPVGITSFNDPTIPAGTTLAMLENTLGVARFISRYPEYGFTLRAHGYELDALTTKVPPLDRRELSHIDELRATPSIEFLQMQYANSRSLSDVAMQQAQILFGRAALRDAGVTRAPGFSLSRSAGNLLTLDVLADAAIGDANSVFVMQRPRSPYQLAPAIPNDVTAVTLTTPTRSITALVAVPELRRSLSEYLEGTIPLSDFYASAERVFDSLRPGQRVAPVFFDLALLARPSARSRFIALYGAASLYEGNMSLRNLSGAAAAVRENALAQTVPLNPYGVAAWKRNEGKGILKPPVPGLALKGPRMNAYLGALALVADDGGFHTARINTMNAKLCEGNESLLEDCKRHYHGYEILAKMVRKRTPLRELLPKDAHLFLKRQLGMYDQVARYRYERERAQ